MPTILAIDPGNEQSAWLFYRDGKPTEQAIAGNKDIAGWLERLPHGDDVLAVEMVACYGMPVGAEVFDTCVWIGRFVQAWHRPYCFIYRKDVKLHLCGTARAKDANIRQRLIDIYGGKEQAIGNKKNPGPLHSIKSHCWSALAVALTAEAKLKETALAGSPA